MIKKLISSLVGCVMLCCTVSAPLVAGSADDSPENYMVFDPEDYGEHIYSYSNDTSLYRSSSDERIPLDEIPINESIIGLDESVIKVMIDPGHNAYENQSPVYSPYWESVMTWKLSNYLQEELQALGVHADLTKSTLEENQHFSQEDINPKGMISSYQYIAMQLLILLWINQLLYVIRIFHGQLLMIQVGK